MKIQTKIIAGFFLITGLVIFLGTTVFFNTNDLTENFVFLVEHDLEVLQNAQKLQKFVVDAETGQRGFIITGDESFLEPYHSGIDGFNSLIELEKELVSDNPPQVQRLEHIGSLFEDWRVEAAQPEISAARIFFEQYPLEDDLFHSDVVSLLKAKTGKNILDQIRNEFAIFIQIENDLKDDRLTNVNLISSYTGALLIFIPVILTAVLILLAFLFTQSIAKPLKILRQAIFQVGVGKSYTKVNQIKDLIVEGKEDEIQGLARSFSDMVTEINKARSQVEKQYTDLKQIDIKKDEFASMVSHELKTPLVPIKLHAEMLLDGEFYGKLSDKQKDAVSQIFKSADNLQRLIDDILDVRKLELGQIQLSKQEVNVKNLLDDNITTLNVFCREKNITLKGEVQNSIKIFADPKRISQVLTNLIKNSIDFVPDKNGQISIIVEKNNSEVIFTVHDNGKGIPLEEQKDIFKKFYQVDTGDRRKHGGTGLGLAICKGIIEAHGGKIWLDTQYTSGASFKFSIPGGNNQ